MPSQYDELLNYSKPTPVPEDKFDAHNALLNYEAPKPANTFTSSIASTLGSGVASKGRALEDFSQANNLPTLQGLGAKARSYGESVVANNPLPVNSFSDVLDKPIDTIKQAVGNAAAFMPENLLAQGAGRAIGTGLGALTGPFAPVAMPALGTFGQFAGGALDAALNTYGGIRDTQDKNNIDNKSAAIVGSLGSGLIEQGLGPQALIGNALFKRGAAETASTIAEKIAAGQLIPEGMSMGEFIAKQLPKTVAKQGFEEGGEELVQNPLEQYTGGDNPLAKASLQQIGRAHV